MSSLSITEWEGRGFRPIRKERKKIFERLSLLTCLLCRLRERVISSRGVKGDDGTYCGA